MITKYLSLRVSADLHALLKRVSESRGEDMSDFARRAILKELASLSFLPDEQKKALGMAAEVP